MTTFQWLNEPKTWSDNASVVAVHTDAKTDFWRRTRNGAERDNGHFYYRNLPGDQAFTATVNVRGEYNARYDQAGLMLRIDEKNWIKCGVEFVNGQQFASVVVTVNGWSDWSIVAIKSPEVCKLRVKREKEAVHIEYAEGENSEYRMMRLAYFPVIENSQSLMMGLMCASPNSDTQGFDVKFEQLNITEHTKID